MLFRSVNLVGHLPVLPVPRHTDGAALTAMAPPRRATAAGSSSSPYKWSSPAASKTRTSSQSTSSPSPAPPEPRQALPLAGDELAALALTLLGSRQWKLASRSQPP